MKKESKEKNSGAKIRPLGDRVLIKELSADERRKKTASGIFIPDTVNEDKGAKEGRVVAVGDGRYEDGKRIPVSVKVGDAVLFQWGDTVKIGEEEYSVVSESNILAVMR